MATHGGKRKNSGRPKGKNTIEKEVLREELRALVAPKLKALVSAQIEQALGLKYLVCRDPKTGKFERIAASQVKGKAGVIEVWEKDPSQAAFADLMNRTIDKPKEQHEVTGDGGGPVIFRWQS